MFGPFFIQPLGFYETVLLCVFFLVCFVFLIFASNNISLVINVWICIFLNSVVRYFASSQSFRYNYNIRMLGEMKNSQEFLT